MRRILRKIAEGDVSNLGDTSTLADPAVVEDFAGEPADGGGEIKVAKVCKSQFQSSPSR